MRYTRDAAIIVDIDGTIALRGDRDPFDHSIAMEDAVNWPVVKAVNALVTAYDWRVILVSGRAEKFREITDYWLWTHGIFQFPNRIALHMRPDSDTRPDQDVKRDIYIDLIAPDYDVQIIFDDRNKVVNMWRELKLPCFQVAEGNY